MRKVKRAGVEFVVGSLELEFVRGVQYWTLIKVPIVSS